MKKFLSVLLSILFTVSVSVQGTAEAIPEETAETLPAIDLDLSQMSSMFVYAEVYQMVSDPDSYLGKTIRVSGWYDAYEDNETKTVYTFCVIQDATACCAQGMEFVWAGDHPFPDVTGQFDLYTEGDTMYIYLANAEVTWDNTEESSS